MIIYEYKCRSCLRFYESPINGECVECVCGELARRWFGSVQIGPRGDGNAFQPHFNHAVGKYVHTSAEFDTALKQAGESAGTEYTRVDPGDVPRPTKDDHIFETQLSTLSRKGFMDSRGKVSIDDGGNFIPQ